MGQLIKGVEATQEQELSGCERSKKSRSSSVKPRINLGTHGCTMAVVLPRNNNK